MGSRVIEDDVDALVRAFEQSFAAGSQGVSLTGGAIQVQFSPVIGACERLFNGPIQESRQS